MRREGGIAELEARTAFNNPTIYTTVAHTTTWQMTIRKRLKRSPQPRSAYVNLPIFVHTSRGASGRAMSLRLLSMIIPLAVLAVSAHTLLQDLWESADLDT